MNSTAAWIAGNRPEPDGLAASAVGAPWAHGGLSFEMQRLSAGIRVVIAMLCTVLLVASEHAPGRAGLLILISYDLWSGLLLWSRTRALRLGPQLLHFWIDAAWACAMLQTSPDASAMLIITLVHPTVLVSVGYGARQGVLLSTVAAGSIFACLGLNTADADHTLFAHWLPALGVLGLIPAAALLTRSMGVLHQQRQLMTRIEADFDPRRGLDSTAATLLQAMRTEAGAALAGLVLPTVAGAPAWLVGVDDAACRRLGRARHKALESHLADLPHHPVSFSRSLHAQRAGVVRVHGPGRAPKQLADPLDALADELGVLSLICVPLTRYGRRHGHLLLGLQTAFVQDVDVEALSHAAPEMLRLIEAATLVDHLQDETAAHERARIGRDLHDSAIQPYLGIKFAVESVAMRVPAGNPLHADVDALRSLVNEEVESLRELIVGMRSGQPHGDTALVTAVRRQSARFAQLFGVEVTVSSPAELPTSRALAGALFHMVNEALNNVRKHTPARQIWISLDTLGSRLELRVRDDAGSVRGVANPAYHPRSLNERVAELGGTLTISCPDGLNAELLIHIPLA